MHWGACGRVGNAFPRPPGAKKKFAQVSVTKSRVRSKFWRYEESCGRSFLFDGSLMRRWLQRAARRPAATASCLQLDALPPRHPPINRSGFARDRPGLGRAVTCNSASAMLLSNHSQRPAAGSIPAQADARRGLLHERALVHHQGLEEVRRACCHCILLP